MSRNKQVVMRLAQALNERNLDEVDDIMAEDYIRHDPTSLMKNAGVMEYKQAFSRLIEAFPDGRWSLEEMFEDDDRIIGRWSFKGTHKGQFFNVAPTGKVVTYPIIGVYRIQEDRIAEDWHVFHALGLWGTIIPEIGALVKKAMEPVRT
jgi:steroid delta-isomerase-like uncharacterized protein